MLVNLSDVLTSPGRVEQATAELELGSLKLRTGIFPVTAKDPVTFTFTNLGMDKARVEGGVKLTFSAPCDRCLTEVPVTLALTFDRIVTSPDIAAEGDEDSRECMEGYQLDVEAFVHNEILVNWPVKVLCRKDCKGVCPKCGQNRNTGDCGCDTFVPDPRMAVIKDIFNANNANKEV